MPYHLDRIVWIRWSLSVMRDLRGLLAIQGLLLALTLVSVPADVGDLRVHLAWTIFLLPGWCLSAAWTGARASLATRYVHAVVSSIGIHAWLSALGFLANIGFRGYFTGFVLVSLILVIARGRHLTRRSMFQRLRLPVMEGLIWIVVMLLIVCIFRYPRSNDIIQFSLQQQDMAVSQSLQPSSIGMEAFGINEPMPRWRSHLWHLVPSLVAGATSLPVEGVLRRWLPIPVAFSTLTVLLCVVRSLAGGRTRLWMVAIATFGPVVLWFRSYNAFNYSFRVTNNFCLDKDICLFLLIPAMVYLGARWLRRIPHSLLPILLLIPAVVKFHPMNAVYLLLLVPFTVIGYDFHKPVREQRSSDRISNRLRTLVTWGQPSTRAIALMVLIGGLFIFVFVAGDAQTAHKQIEAIIRIDWRAHLTGRPLHYWVGQYASIPDHGLALDTTEWIDGKLTMRSRVLLDCGLLGAMHAALLVWMFVAYRNRVGWVRRRCVALCVVLAMLWGLWAGSPLFLTQWPHFLAGYERLHWFAYLPALVAISGCINFVLRLDLDGRTNRRFGLVGPVVAGRRKLCSICAVITAVLLAFSALEFRLRRPSLLTRLPYLNSILDYELAEQRSRDKWYEQDSTDQGLVPIPPPFLQPRDRVLFLDTRTTDQYWFIKQGIFWSELYAEAYAWKLLGDSFLVDRQMFYRLQDRQAAKGVRAWLASNRVTLIVDPRPGADAYLMSLNQRAGLGMDRVQSGVWRTRLGQVQTSP